ncbi:ArnT family glycosyltransferase [Amycolatopsis sp. NPDC004378]
MTTAILLAATAGLYFWRLGVQGWSNTYYAAAVQAATKDWKAFLFGAVDWGNGITVDKPPLSTWVMALFCRVFGFSQITMIIPQVLAGVAAVYLVYRIARGVSGPAAGLLAGVVMALTPVVVSIFRNNNPDAILTLLLVASAATLLTAVRTGRLKWMAWTGALVGLAFLAKSLLAVVVLLPLAAGWLIAADTGLGRRLAGLAAGAGALLVSAGWWVALAELWPAGSRPYIGGSSDNSVLDLIFGYNGLGRLTGAEQPGGGSAGMPGPPSGMELPGGMQPPTAGGMSFGGGTGIGRMFNEQFGGQIAWLLPLALVAAFLLLLLRWRAPRTDATRALAITAGLWILAYAVVFSFMSGTIHRYYPVVLAPAIAVLTGAGAVEAWRNRASLWVRLTAAVTVLGTAVLAYALLHRTPEFQPWLKFAILGAGVVAAVALFFESGNAAKLGTALGLAAVLAGPASYSLVTAGHAQLSPDFAAGPKSQQELQSGRPGGIEGLPSGPAPSMSMSGGMTEQADPQLVSFLKQHKGAERWAAATVSTVRSSVYQLELGEPVLGTGGFLRSDPYPTVSQLEEYVRTGQLRYFVTSDEAQQLIGQLEKTLGTALPDLGGSSAMLGNTELTQWVKSHGKLVDSKLTEGQEVYDLAPTG